MREGEHGISAGLKVPQEAALRERPWQFDWFNVMRWLEAHNPSFPRFGTALRPGDEIVRISQKPSLSFAPATLARFGGDRHGRVRIEQQSFGLYGPNGPMPLHFTEHARERIEYDDDPILCSFLDIFHHRFALMFYRAWASAQATNSLDRSGEDSFGRYISSLTGYGEAVFEGRDSVPDHARRYMSGHLARLTRNPEGLASILQDFFACPFRVEEWMPRWLRIEEGDCTALGVEAPASQLGRGAICGTSVLDRQHSFRIHVGPLKMAQYLAFLPQRKHFLQLRDWVRNYVGDEFAWDLRVIMLREEVAPLRLGMSSGMLGWSSWMGSPPGSEDRGDLVFEGEKPEMPHIS